MNYLTAFDLIIANQNKGAHNIAIGYAAHNNGGTPITRYASFYVPSEVAESVAEFFFGLEPFLIEAIVKDWKSNSRFMAKTFAFGVAEEGSVLVSEPFTMASVGGFFVCTTDRFNHYYPVSTTTKRKENASHKLRLITKA